MRNKEIISLKVARSYFFTLTLTGWIFQQNLEKL